MERSLSLASFSGAARARLGAGEWLRVALLAGLASAGVAIAFDLAVAERVVDRAVALEGDHGLAAVPEPFSRAGQRGGLVAGMLILGAGAAFLLAGAATLAGPRTTSPRRLWLLVSAGALWAVVVVPSAVYPPLPPGVDSQLSVHERQGLYLAAVGIGLAGLGAALRIWSSRARARVPLACACLLVPAGLAVRFLPERGDDVGALAPGVLTDFRIVSVASQLLFWGTMALAGAWLLRPERAADTGAPAT